MGPVTLSRIATESQDFYAKHGVDLPLWAFLSPADQTEMTNAVYTHSGDVMGWPFQFYGEHGGPITIDVDPSVAKGTIRWSVTP